MVFISKNPIRKCRWCDKPAKKHFNKQGRNKGYCRTCGDKLCLKRQYTDTIVCKSKSSNRTPTNYICACCGNKFTALYSHHIRYCKECVPNPSWSGRVRRYGIGKKQFDGLLMKQNNKCALCDRVPEVIDHCHKNKEYRGLLCQSCNMYIARFDNDLNWLLKALNYMGVKYAISFY